MKLVKIGSLNLEDKEFDFFKVISKQFLIIPIIIEPVNSKNKIIYGHNLLSIYNKYNLDSIPAILLEKFSTKEKITFIANYHQKFFKLLPTEISRIINYLLKNKIEIDDQVLKTLKIGDYKNRITEIAEIYTIDKIIAGYLDDKIAPIKTCIHTVQIAKDSEEFLIILIKKLKPSLSIYNEIVQTIYEISIRNGIKIYEVLKNYKLEQIVKMSDISLEDFTDLIYKIRYPIISKYNDEIKKLIRQKKLPENIKINWDRTLEKRMIDVNIKIDKKINEDRLKEFLTDDFLRFIKSIKEIID